MLELKFTVDEMEELIRQGDAKYLNPDKVLVTVYHSLYKKYGDCYENVEQRVKIEDERREK